jgi:hypothetical protein
MSQRPNQYEREQAEMKPYAEEFVFRNKLIDRFKQLKKTFTPAVKTIERIVDTLEATINADGVDDDFYNAFYGTIPPNFEDGILFQMMELPRKMRLTFDEFYLTDIIEKYLTEEIEKYFGKGEGIPMLTTEDDLNGAFEWCYNLFDDMRQGRETDPNYRPVVDLEDLKGTFETYKNILNKYFTTLDELITIVSIPLTHLQAMATKYMRTGFYNYGSGRFSQADQDRKKGRANVFVLTCIDPRYITDVFEFLLKDKKLHANFDLFTLAGASAGVMETEWDKAFLDNLGLGIQLHGIKEVWCFDHLDCGMYKATFGLEKDDDVAIHLECMARLKEYLQQKFPQLSFRKFIVGQDGEVMKFGGVKPPRVHAPKEYVKVNNVRRNRFEAPQEIVRQALKDVEKISKIPYKKMSEKKSKFFFWGENPVKDVPAVLIDLPIIEVETLRKRDVRKDVIFHTLESMKKEGFKMFNKGCIVVHNGEILTIYITGKDDKALSESAKHLYDLGKQFTEYYPRKEATFYTHDKILLKGNPTLKEKRAFKKNMAKVEKTDRYYGFNALDGQIKYYSAPNHSAVIDYHPRKPEASFDEKFLYNLIFSYAALYMLEERYAPAVAKFRLMKAEQVEKAEAIPGVPLKDLPATSLGMSENFASALHDDSGIKGITESIIWSKVGQDKESYFVNDQTKMAFDLSDENAMILIPPKVSHGTANTGEHGGFGFVIITKANLVFNTPLNKEWHSAWNGYLGTSLAKERFTSSRKG